MNEQVESAGRAALRTGRVVGGLVCLAFVLAGILFGWLIGREAWADVQTQLWKPVPCTILQSDTPDQSASKSGPYSIRIRFEYRWNQERYVSDRIHRNASKFGDYQDVQRLLDRYRTNSTSTCRVNPARPTEAVLEKSTPWIALALVIPLVFVIMGVIGFYAALFGHGQNGLGAVPISRMADHGPISARAGRVNTHPGCLFLFFLIFFAAGSAILFVTFIRPHLLIHAASSWDQVPCRILSSEVKSHRGKSTTYSVEILYEYQVSGRPYRANRHSFFRMATSGRDGKAEVVRRYPPGRETVCYVNPADSTDVVLDRGASAVSWFGLIPLVFVLLGLGGMTHAWRTSRRGRADVEAAGRQDPIQANPIVRTSTMPDDALVLRSTKGRVGKVLGVLLFGAFWNGIVSVFVVQFIKDAQRGNVDWFHGLFLTPFVVIGLVLIGLVVYYGLACFAPRPTLTLDRRQIRPGESVDVQWHFSGRAHVIERLRISLEGVEEATYRRGTSTSTDRNVFTVIEIASPVTADEVRTGQARLTLPADAVPTWRSSNNGIVWNLCVKGVIHLYPDIDDSFPIVILPSAQRKPPAPDPT